MYHRHCIFMVNHVQKKKTSLSKWLIRFNSIRNLIKCAQMILQPRVRVQVRASWPALLSAMILNDDTSPEPQCNLDFHYQRPRLSRPLDSSCCKMIGGSRSWRLLKPNLRKNSIIEASDSIIVLVYCQDFFRSNSQISGFFQTLNAIFVNAVI